MWWVDRVIIELCWWTDEANAAACEHDSSFEAEYCDDFEEYSPEQVATVFLLSLLPGATASYNARHRRR